jgi:hypothetical protein
VNDLGPEGGMALAEALKSNTTLEWLKSAALPSNPPADALRPHSMHTRCTGPLHLFLRRLLEGPTLPALALLTLASPFAQP